VRALGLHVKWALTLVLACGCNQVFGLDSPGGGEENADARDHDAVVVDAAGDRDMDGVIDDEDDCPDAADPQQFDEDGDGRGDRCDLCPHLNQNDDVDSEEDGIPDACDPYPSISGGRLRFSGFHTTDDLDAWTATGGGAVELDGDAAHLIPLLDGEVKLLLRDDDNQQTMTRVIADLELEAPNAGASTRRAVGAVTDVNPAGTDSFLCQLETDLPGPGARVQMYRFEGGFGASMSNVSISSFPLGHVTIEFDLGHDQDDDQMLFGGRCQIGGDGGSHLLARTAATPLAPGEAGLRTVGVPVRVSWIVVIDHP
jgi:hypothetical protein